MTSTELALVTPGETVGYIRHGGAQITETDITLGTAPDTSTLAAEDARVFVTTDDMGKPDIAVGYEGIHDGQAVIGIESISGRGLEETSFVQRLITETMAKSNVKLASLSPNAVASIPKEALPQIGFHLDDSGEDYTFSLTA